MSTRLGHQEFSRTTAAIESGTGETAPSTAPNLDADAWNIDEVVELSIAVKLPVVGSNTSFNLTIYGSLDNTNWFIINNGGFETQTNFLESFQVSPLKYIKPIISSTAGGAGTSTYTIIGRGSRKRG